MFASLGMSMQMLIANEGRRLNYIYF